MIDYRGPDSAAIAPSDLARRLGFVALWRARPINLAGSKALGGRIDGLLRLRGLCSLSGSSGVRQRGVGFRRRRSGLSHPGIWHSLFPRRRNGLNRTGRATHDRAHCGGVNTLLAGFWRIQRTLRAPLLHAGLSVLCAAFKANLFGDGAGSATKQAF